MWFGFRFHGSQDRCHLLSSPVFGTSQHSYSTSLCFSIWPEINPIGYLVGCSKALISCRTRNQKVDYNSGQKTELIHAGKNDIYDYKKHQKHEIFDAFCHLIFFFKFYFSLFILIHFIIRV